MEGFFLLADLVCVLSAVFQRKCEFHDLKSMNLGDPAGHLLINGLFGMKNLLFKLIQEKHREISGVAILD